MSKTDDPEPTPEFDPALAGDLLPKENIIHPSLWRTPTTNLIDPASTRTGELSKMFAALIPGVQPGRHHADERVLHLIGNKLYTQRLVEPFITYPKITVDAPNEIHYAIRCWVVHEPSETNDPAIVLLLDRLLQINGAPFPLHDLTAHAAFLREVMGRLRSPDGSIRFNTVCRCTADKVEELLAVATTQIPHVTAGIRFELPNAPSPSTDLVWFSADETAPTIGLLADIARGHVILGDQASIAKKGDRRMYIRTGCATFQCVNDFFQRVKHNQDCGIELRGLFLFATQAALAMACRSVHSSPE
jgi:hypothetical protein